MERANRDLSFMKGGLPVRIIYLVQERTSGDPRLNAADSG